MNTGSENEYTTKAGVRLVARPQISDIWPCEGCYWGVSDEIRPGTRCTRSLDERDGAPCVAGTRRDETDIIWMDVSLAPKFRRGGRVRKTKGSEWQGRIVGEYSTTLTPEGYAVESEAHAGSVQIYPVGALELVGRCATKEEERTKLRDEVARRVAELETLHGLLDHSGGPVVELRRCSNCEHWSAAEQLPERCDRCSRCSEWEPRT